MVDRRKIIDLKKNLELKKHVGTIHSYGKLSLLQRKIANALIFNAYDHLLERDEHVIHVATLCNLIGYDSNDHKTIKRALVNLLATVVEWNLLDGERLAEEGIWNASSIIADASIHGPLCTYSYSNKMRGLLFRPEIYGRLNMLVQAKFQSNYGLALYENCIRFQNLDQTPQFELDTFRKLMGVEDGKYKIFRDFKNRVLAKAVEEVNKYSPVILTPKFHKQGRNVVAIQFLIKPRIPKRTREQQKEKLKLSELLKLSFGLSRRQIEEVLSNYSEEYILEKMNIVETSPSFIQGKITHLAKYLLCALQDDYQPAKSSKQIIEIVREDPVEKSALKRLEQNRAEQYFRFENKAIIKLFGEQTDLDKQAILVEFDKYLGKGIYHDIYLRDGMSNILIQDQLCLFLKQKRPAFIRGIPTYTEFCAQLDESAAVEVI